MFNSRAFLLTSILCSIAFGALEDEQLKRAVAFLKNHQVNIESARMRYLVEEENNDIKDPAAGKTFKNKMIHDFTFMHDKIRLDTYESSIENNELQLVKTNTFNGEKYYSYAPLYKQGSIYSKGSFPMTYNNYAYFLEDGILSFLENNDKFTISSIKVEEEEMVSFSLDSSDGLQHTEIILNPTANYQPKIIRRHGFTPEHLHGKTPIRESTYEIKVKKYLEVDGFYFPADIITRYDVLLNNGQTVPFLTRKVIVEHVTPNVVIDDQIFELSFPQGTKLTHYDYRITHVVGAAPAPEAEVDNILDTNALQVNNFKKSNEKPLVLPSSSKVLAKDSNDSIQEQHNDKIQLQQKSISYRSPVYIVIVILVASCGIALGLWKISKKSTNYYK